MLYAILCYHDEDAVGSWTKEQDAAVMGRLSVVHDRLVAEGKGLKALLGVGAKRA